MVYTYIASTRTLLAEEKEEDSGCNVCRHYSSTHGVYTCHSVIIINVYDILSLISVHAGCV